jgi:hypothetical protein
MTPVDESDSRVEAAVDVLMHPPVIPDALTCLTTLRESGYYVIGFFTVDATTFNNRLRANR